MICDRCSTELPADAVACYKCGTMTDATFVRPLGAVTHHPKIENAFDRGIKLVAVAALVVLGIVGVVIAISVLNQSKNVTVVTSTPKVTQAETQYKPPPSTATFTPTPIPKPPPAEQEQQFQQPPQMSNAVNRTAPPPPRNTAPSDATAQCRDGSFSYSFAGVCESNGGVLQWYVSGVNTTRAPRAICNDGHISYWQGDRAFVCLTGSGVRHWYW